MAPWNYKSALLSAAVRAPMFLAVNLPAGQEAALAAFGTEFWFRLSTAGFYGGLTESFSRRSSPRRRLLALVLVPGLAHSVEFMVHTWRGTPYLAQSLTVSIAFTVVSTGFHLFAMGQGLLIAGEGRQPILQDLRAMPRLTWLFALALLRPWQRP